MLEVYIYGREADNDRRTGAIATGPCSIRAVLPDGSVFSCDVPADAVVVLEVTEHPAELAVAAAAAMASPDPAQAVIVDPASGIPKLEPLAQPEPAVAPADPIA